MKRIIVAVTGASGAVYARKVAERLLRSPQVAQVAVVCSANGRKVMEYERERLPEGEERMVWFDNDDLFARPVTTVWSSCPVRWAAPDASLPVSPAT